MSSKNNRNFQQQRQQAPSDQDELKQALDTEVQQGESAVAQEGAEGQEQQQDIQSEQAAAPAVLFDKPVQEAKTENKPHRGQAPQTGTFDEAAFYKAAHSPQAIAGDSDEQASDPLPPTAKEESRGMKSVELDLISYMEALHPSKVVSEETGASWQNSLFMTFKRVLGNTDPEAFKLQWRALLAFFHEHSDEMFNERFMFRFQNSWKSSNKDFTQFRHLLFLAMRTANPQTRAANAREIVFDRITPNLSAQAATNLVNFYA